MSGPKGRASVIGGELLIACVVAALVLAVATAAAARGAALERSDRRSSDERVLSEVTTGVAVDLERGLVHVAEVARDATAPGAAPPAGFVPADPGRPTATAPTLSSADRAVAEVAAALDRARDTGEAITSPPVDLGDGPRLLLVAAAYRRDPLVGRPQSTVARRARLEGWAVVPVDLARVARAHLGTGAVASIADGHASWSATAAPVPSRLPARTLEIEGRQLEIRAGSPEAVGWPGSSLALLAVGLAVAAAVGGTVLVLGRQLRSTRAAADDLGAQVRLIGEVAPLVQQSLELADVLPGVAVQLSDHFGLEGVALSTVTSGAGPVELFAIGETPDPAVKAVLRPPAHLAAGATLALALQRGGRSVALLRLVAGRDLDESELQSLRAITELVTAAVVNASLYASQQEALRRLRDLDALKTVFLGTASHELRTPVTAIGGFASLLATSWDRFDDAQRRDFVGRIAANARSLGAVVQDLLDFSLLDKGTVAVTLEAVDLVALVGTVVERLAPVLDSHTISFSATPAPEIAGDVNAIERIVTNLLTNATKFSPAGTTVSVSVAPGAQGYAAEVVVADQGPGIPADERERVFTRFFRGAGEAVSQTRGVGIGLSVVAELVARLRGEVEVDDAPGGGARFTVRFPAGSDQLLAKEAVHAPTT